jgi:hypothetical protein
MSDADHAIAALRAMRHERVATYVLERLVQIASDETYVCTWARRYSDAHMDAVTGFWWRIYDQPWCLCSDGTERGALIAAARLLTA